MDRRELYPPEAMNLPIYHGVQLIKKGAMKMNNKRFYTREEVEATGKPFFTGHRWIGLDGHQKRILLTRTRCQKLNRPVGNGENPAAFRYSIHAPANEKYIPLYDRTKEKISEEELFPREIYPIRSQTRLRRLSLTDIIGQKKNLIIETFERTTFKKTGLNAVDMQTQEVLPLSHIYYRIRNIRDHNGNIIAKRKSPQKELFLVM